MLSVGGEGWAIGRPIGIDIHLVVLLKKLSENKKRIAQKKWLG